MWGGRGVGDHTNQNEYQYNIMGIKTKTLHFCGVCWGCMVCAGVSGEAGGCLGQRSSDNSYILLSLISSS